MDRAGNSSSRSRPALSTAAVQQAVARIFALDGKISWERAVLYGSIIRSLSDAQRAKLKLVLDTARDVWGDA